MVVDDGLAAPAPEFFRRVEPGRVRGQPQQVNSTAVRLRLHPRMAMNGPVVPHQQEVAVGIGITERSEDRTEFRHRQVTAVRPDDAPADRVEAGAEAVAGVEPGGMLGGRVFADAAPPVGEGGLTMERAFVTEIEPDSGGMGPRRRECPPDPGAFLPVGGIRTVHAHPPALQADAAAVEDATDGGQGPTGQPGEPLLQIAPAPAAPGTPTQRRFTPDEVDQFAPLEGGKSPRRGRWTRPATPPAA